MEDTKSKDIVVLEYFLAHPDSFIGEISEALSIPKSSVQRYIKKYQNINITSRGITIKEQLEINKVKGKKKGGNNFFKNNDSLRDENGKFVGSVKTTSETDKEEEKKKDIILIADYYLKHSTDTIDEIVSFFETLGMYSRSYVYDCLTSKKSEEILGKDTFDKIQEQLESNQYSFLRKSSDIDIENLITQADLSDDEKYIVSMRMTGKVSLDELAKILGVSRTTIEAYEKKAIEKLRKASKKESK